MILIVKRASYLSAEEKENTGITGIPNDWPIEVLAYTGDVPAGFEMMTEEDLATLRTNNQAAYDAWLAPKHPLFVQTPDVVIIDTPKDTDNAQIVRIKTNTYGWVYHDRYLQATTSTLNSLVNRKPDLSQGADITVRFYSAEDIELLTQEEIDVSCVKTVIDMEPSYDYELISSTIFTVEKTTQPVYLTCIIAPRILNSLGNKCVLSGADFSQKNEVVIKGGTVKKLYYAPYHSNEIRSILVHPAGFKVKVNFCIGHYLA